MRENLREKYSDLISTDHVLAGAGQTSAPDPPPPDWGRGRGSPKSKESTATLNPEDPLRVKFARIGNGRLDLS